MADRADRNLLAQRRFYRMSRHRCVHRHEFRGTCRRAPEHEVPAGHCRSRPKVPRRRAINGLSCTSQEWPAAQDGRYLPRGTDGICRRRLRYLRRARPVPRVRRTASRRRPQARCPEAPAASSRPRCRQRGRQDAEVCAAYPAGGHFAQVVHRSRWSRGHYTEGKGLPSLTACQPRRSSPVIASAKPGAHAGRWRGSASNSKTVSGWASASMLRVSVRGVSVRGSRFGGSRFGGSPFGGSPFGGSPFGGSPFGGSPFGGSPFGGSPFGGSPFGGSPFG